MPMVAGRLVSNTLNTSSNLTANLFYFSLRTLNASCILVSFRTFPIFQIMFFFCFKLFKILTFSVIAVKLCQMNLFWAGILAFELSNFQGMPKFFSTLLMSMQWKRTQSYYAITTCKSNRRLSKAELYIGVYDELLFQIRLFFP